MTKLTLLEKIVAMLPFLGSQRFWQLAIVVTLFTLRAHGIIPDNTLGMVSEIIEIVLGTSVAIRTIDKVTEGK